MAEQRARAFNGTLGASVELTREWRASGALSGGSVQIDGQPRSLNATGTGGLTWTSHGLSFGEWRYTPSLGASGSARLALLLLAQIVDVVAVLQTTMRTKERKKTRAPPHRFPIVIVLPRLLGVDVRRVDVL